MLTIHGLKVRLGGIEVLHGIDMELPGGSYGIIVGPSGSGKTTLLRAIAGLIEYEGTVTIGRRRVDTLPPWERGVALVQQIPGLLPHLTIEENVALAARLRRSLPRNEATQLAATLLSEMGLLHVARKKPGELSGGQLQRAAIAAALATGAELLLLDEPLSHLDRMTAEKLRSLLARLRGKTTILHVTHDLDEALALGDYMYIIHQGRIVASGPVARVYHCPRSREAAQLLGHGVAPGHLLGLENDALYSIPPEGVTFHEAPGTAWRLVEATRERGRLRLAARHREGWILYSYQHPSQKPPKLGASVKPVIASEPCPLEAA
jgi:ABC-type Fe3+/spermidine/putrescine transport system ATPase subunit